MSIRLSGLNSGLDTESIITELVKAKSTKKDSLVKAQTKLQWKQEAWKDLNTKVYSFYSKTLSNMTLESGYVKKTTTVGNPNAVSVITGANAVNGVQTLKIDQLAKTGYLTGAELKSEDGSKYTSSSKLVDDLGLTSGSSFTITSGGTSTEITVNDDMTVSNLVSQLQSAGVNASFDEKNQRFFISSKNTGLDNDFSITASDQSGLEALQKLGISTGNLDSSVLDSFSQYIDTVTDADGNTSYVQKDLSSLIDEQADSRLSAYQASLDALKENQAKQAEITDKYGSLKDLSADELQAKYDELLPQLDDDVLTEEDKANVQAELDAITELQSLQSKATDLQAAVDAEADNFTVDSTGTAAWADGKREEAVAEATEKVNAEAAFALNYMNGSYSSAGATRIYGQDAVITLNGATFNSSGNTFEINGLTITANTETDEEFTVTTADDTDGIYDMVKNFFSEYNTLINEMDKLYNADSASDYDPLTDDEKDEMSDSEVEKWETKIKDALLRKDSTLGTVSSALKNIMLQGVTMSDGSKMYLSSFGIETLGYFTAADNEKNAYHIDGDPDDSNTSGNSDKLKTMIANDPSTVVEFFTTLSKSLYSKLGDLMKSTDYSSAFTLYDDKYMQTQYDDYTDKISDQEDLIADYEDRYYSKFTAMETALTKLNSKESAISGLLS